MPHFTSETIRLKKNYRLALMGIGLLLVISQIIIQYQISLQQNNASLINVAGKQRMLSQRLTKSVLAYGTVTTKEDKAFWHQQSYSSLESLEKGHSQLLFISSEKYAEYRRIQSKLSQLSPLVYQLRQDIEQALKSEKATQVTGLLETEARFLPLMDSLVKEYEHVSYGEMQWLRWLEAVIFILALGLLILEARLIFRPMINNLNASILSRDKVNKQLMDQNESLEEARLAAEAAARAKSNFLANMSHEIRTPMNGILGMADLMKHTKLNLEQQEFLDTITQSADSLLVIINDILDLSKIEAGKIDLESVPFSLQEVCESSMALLSASATKKKLELVLDWDMDIPPQAIGDSLRIRQILLNLLGNGVKFTEKGHVCLQAKLITHSDSHQEIELHIIDTGIGISHAQQVKLFEPFTQADSSTTRQYGGTGLGLTISHQLVELMGGQLEISSQLGKGSDFFFTLRLENSKHPGTEESEREALKGLEGKYLWLVDDYPLNLRVLEKLCAIWGIRYMSFNDPTKALEMALTVARQAIPELPDAILLDYQMPNMDGVALRNELLQIKVFTEIPSLLISSSALQDEEDRGLFTACLQKPARSKTLGKVLLEALVAPATSAANITHLPQTMLEENKNREISILLAEDHPVNRKYMLKLFERIGYSIDVAKDGQQAWEMAKIKPYDLIFMDVQMPKLNGLEATRQILSGAEGNTQTPIIIALTANVMESDRNNCLEAGMRDFLTKPIKMSEVKTVLEKWVPILQS